MRRTILLISPYWREEHRWMVSSYKMAELWQRLGYRVVVACMGSSNRVEDISETLTVHFRKDIFLPDPWNYGIALGFSGYVRKLADSEKPEIVVVNKLLFWTSLAAIPLRLRGYKVIQLTDALVGMTWWPRGKVPQIAAAIYAWTLGWMILKAAHRVVFFHPQPERLIHRLGISHKAQVIPTGIDPSGYSADAKKTGEVIVTYLGRLESVKGVDDFVAAAVPLSQEFPQMVIQVVGWFKKDHPLVEEYGNHVRFTGLRDDVPAILADSHIFVLPSYSEGLSNALMEAMSSACACVASEVGGNAFLLQNGVSGFLFPPGDREALRSHLRRLMDDAAKRRDLGQAARKRIEEVFSWDVVGNQYQSLFDSVQNNS